MFVVLQYDRDTYNVFFLNKGIRIILLLFFVNRIILLLVDKKKNCYYLSTSKLHLFFPRASYTNVGFILRFGLYRNYNILISGSEHLSKQFQFKLAKLQIFKCEGIFLQNKKCKIIL